jgi:phosphatidylinositol-3-phosphatase
MHCDAVCCILLPVENGWEWSLCEYMPNVDRLAFGLMNPTGTLFLFEKSTVEVRPSKRLSGLGAIIFSLLTIFGFSRTVAAGAPKFSNVFIVVEENRRYSDVVGSPLMPYLNMLINNYGLATQCYANQHHSLPNYLWLTSGSNDGVTIDTCSPVISQDNAVQELSAAGVSWKAYEQGLPSVGYLGCTSVEYVKRHDPFAYYDVMLDSTAQEKHIVPLTLLSTDVVNNSFARYNFITPDLCHDMHSDPLCTNGCTSWSSSACWTEADKWLRWHIGPVLNTNMFQAGGSGLLKITFDESVGSDTTHGGGHAAWVVISPLAKRDGAPERSGNRSGYEGIFQLGSPSWSPWPGPIPARCPFIADLVPG